MERSVGWWAMGMIWCKLEWKSLTHQNVATSWDQRLLFPVGRNELPLRQRDVGLRPDADNEVLGDLGVAQAEPACRQR